MKFGLSSAKICFPTSRDERDGWESRVGIWSPYVKNLRVPETSTAFGKLSLTMPSSSREDEKGREGKEGGRKRREEKEGRQTFESKG